MISALGKSFELKRNWLSASFSFLMLLMSKVVHFLPYNIFTCVGWYDFLSTVMNSS